MNVGTWFASVALVLGHVAAGQEFRCGTPEGYVVAQLNDARRPKAVLHDRSYYWVRSRQILVTQGGVGGTVLHGPYSMYADNGQLLEAGRFDAGLKDGEWRRWNAEGRLLAVEQWRSGQLHGKVLRFPQEGGVAVEERYRRGKLRGRSDKRKASRTEREPKEQRDSKRQAADEATKAQDPPGSETAKPVKKKKKVDRTERTNSGSTKEKTERPPGRDRSKGRAAEPKVP